LMYWSALIVLVFGVVISLSVLLHRQWAEKERIRYPVAELAGSLLMVEQRGQTTVVHQRLFWLGFLSILLVRTTTGLRLWFPESIEIPLQFDFSALRNRFPEFMATPGADSLAIVRLFPACIGFAYLLASEISFSVGIVNIISVCITYLLIVGGVDLSGGVMTGNAVDWVGFGSFLAMGGMLIYVGRRYYWQTFKGAIGLARHVETYSDSVQALRIFGFCVVGAVVLLVAAGLDWPLAIFAVVTTLLVFVVIARLNAECGTFFFAPGWMMPGVAVGLLGSTTLGPKMLIILGLVTYVFTIDPFECLMPYIANGLKIAGETSLPVGRVGLVLGLTLLLVLAVTIPTAVWADYNWPAEMERGWDSSALYNAAERIASELTLSGRVEMVRHYTALERLRHMKPDRRFLVAAGIGFGAMVLFAVLRLRFSWWPLHPVLVLAFGAGLLYKFCASFFLGWLAKITVMRLGGARRYNQYRPFMIGIIVGDLTGSFLIMLGSWLYFLATGVQSPATSWLPW
ncbi:MAG: hypothetical protein N3G20_07040, partial [Verrucomicrobiae bacterium]|nr:hypothetical protein [Verrucomicrobiae bacterium]